ncbi:hypothetical protein [Microbacterium sp.]|uniref:hypothetical protein n=1 Tax=Microbacterium sp. TaxID=51671 RepID=UPI003C7697AE
MHVSAEMIAIILTGVGLLFALAGGFGWMIVRMDAQFAVLGAKIDGVQQEVNATKVAVAHLEGMHVKRLELPR